MAAWTQDDIDCLKAAIKAKAIGKRVTALQLGDRTEQFADASLDQLRALLDEMELSVNTHRGRVARSRFDKAL